MALERALLGSMVMEMDGKRSVSEARKICQQDVLNPLGGLPEVIELQTSAVMAMSPTVVERPRRVEGR